jgi:hypothetical protein
MLYPSFKFAKRPFEETVKEYTTAFDVNLSSFPVLPWLMRAAIKNSRQTTIEFVDELAVY